MNRAERTSITDALRRAGCTCLPEFVELPAAMRAEGASTSVATKHAPACPLAHAARDAREAGEFMRLRADIDDQPERRS